MFTENQVRQFYVIPVGSADTTNVQQPTAIVPGTSGTYPADLNPSSKSAGACQFVINPTGDEAYLNYKGPKDGQQRSDLIKKCNVIDVRLTDATDLVHKNKTVLLTLDSSLVNSDDELTTTGDYIVNVSIRNFLSMDYNTTKIKFGAVRGAEGDAAKTFYAKMAISLAKSFAREPIPYVKVYVTTDASGDVSGYTEVTASTALSSLTGTYVGVVIEEAEQPWRLGAAPVEYVDFTVEPSTIFDGGNDVIWGKVQVYGNANNTDGTTGTTTGTVNTQPNSKKVADMEWFFMKERADKYGMIDWPYNIDTELMVSSTLDAGYSFVDIHYYFEGNSHNVGHSEKTLTIVGSKANLNRLIGVATPGSETGLFKFLKGTDTPIKKSASWN